MLAIDAKNQPKGLVFVKAANHFFFSRNDEKD
jgi:hypothetical protein